MMIDDGDIWDAALRQGMIPGFDFAELPRDSIQRDAVIILAAEYHVAATRPRLPQRIPQFFQARLNLVSEFVREPLESGQLLLFVRHGRLSCLRGHRRAAPESRGIRQLDDTTAHSLKNSLV